MAIQNTRIIRFLMVLSIVVLTIFIYASYYSNPGMQISPHIMRASSASLVSSSTFNINTNNLNNVNNNVNNRISINNSNNFDEVNSSSSNTNSNNIGSNSTFASPLIRSAELLNSNNYLNDNNKHNIVLDMDSNGSVVSQNTDAVSNRSTNNIQKIINNADRILKNLTISNVNAAENSTMVRNNGSLLTLLSQQQQPQPQPPQSPIATNNAILTGGSGPSAPSSALILPLDPSKGISTALFYEGGHLDANPLICPDEGDPIRLLIIITSAPTHREARLAIRQTWGHYGTRRDVAIAFILGQTNNTTIEDDLNNENYIYGDLIRGNFVDSYNNLTLKTISTLEWVDENCPHINFLLKTDDDMFINVPKLLLFMDKHKNDKRVIYGRLAKKWKPIHNKKSKYYVAPGQFSKSIFPDFTTGPAYLMTGDTVHDLYIKSLQQTYLKLEDVFTTGIVAQQLNIKRIHVNEFLNRRIAFNPCNIRKAISVHMIKSNEQFDLWKKLLDQTTKCK